MTPSKDLMAAEERNLVLQRIAKVGGVEGWAPSHPRPPRHGGSV